MLPIIQPVDRNIIEKELNKDVFVRKTNYGNNQIFIITHFNAPNVLREIGRLREVTFRDAGGGTGKEMDLDEFDLNDNPYKQLIVWNPRDREIIGGYRFIELANIKRKADGNFDLATSELFKLSEKFIKEYMPYTIELGRSFVQTPYQPSSKNRKGLFSLDNIWDGLGVFVVDNPNLKYYFGKVTMYRSFNIKARDLLLYFMHKHFPDSENLVSPIESLPIITDEAELKSILTADDYATDYKLLFRNIRALGENIPPLINSYMNISPTMRTFGTSLNLHFGDVEETGIMVNVADIYNSKKERHIVSYIKEKNER
jgi:hypothetical protein